MTPHPICTITNLTNLTDEELIMSQIKPIIVVVPVEKFQYGNTTYDTRVEAERAEEYDKGWFVD